MAHSSKLRTLATLLAVAATATLAACSSGGGGSAPSDNGATGTGKLTIGIAVAGWQSSPYFWHKTGFVVVVVGIPVLVAVLEIGWLIVKPKVVEHTGGRLESVWTDTGPRYGSTPTITEEGN